MENRKVEKIPCLKCDKVLYGKIRPMLKKWKYSESMMTMGDGDIRLIVIDFHDHLGWVTDMGFDALSDDHNRYLETDVHKFLAKAAELMGKVYIKPHCLVSELPERIRRLAEARRTGCVNESLIGNHSWEGTPEGFDFWDNLYEGRIPDNLEEVLTKFEKNSMEEKTLKMSVERARELHKQGGDIAKWIEENFSKEELNPLPKTWEEWVEQNPISKGEYYFNDVSCLDSIIIGAKQRDASEDKNLCPSESSAKAHLALIQLERLRDCYRQGWKPDWANGMERKWCIEIYCGEVKESINVTTSCFLSFQDEVTRNLFRNNFRDLIEQAKELL